MRKKDSHKLRILNDRGFTLVGVLMVLIVLSVLGLGITAVASNSLKVSTGERDDQSVYYIAEAGLTEVRAKINALAKEAFVKIDEEYRNIEKALEKEAYLIEKSFEERFLETAENKIEKYISENQPSVVKKYESHFDIDDEPTATITVIPNEDKANSYIIKSVGSIEGKSRTVSQVVTVSFGHDLTTEEISIDGSDSSEGTFKACANAYLNSAMTSGSAKFEGDIILREDSTLNMGGSGGVGGNIYSYGNLTITNSAPIARGIYSNGSVKLLNAMEIGNNVYALGDITFNNTATVSGNVFSKSGILISNNPILKGQLYAKGTIDINGQPKVSGDIISQSAITLSNGEVKANEIVTSKIVNVKNGSYNNIRENVAVGELPKPIYGFTGLVDVSQLYEGSDCTNLDDENFKPQVPDVTFPEESTSLPKDTQLVKLTDIKKELYFNEFKPANQWNNPTDITIELPFIDEDTVYSLYVNDLDMKNLDITILGDGKLNIYVKNSLFLGKVIQGKDSKGKKRRNFDTTIYYLNDNKKELTLSSWGNCKIEANIYVKNASLKTNGCTINGNIVVLGNNKVTIAGNNTTNGQLFYLPESDLIATGLVNVNGYVVARNMSGSGNVNIFNPTSGDGSINTDIFDKPSSPSTIEVKNYIAKTLLLAEQQKEK